MKLRYTPQARLDLKALRDYIAVNLGNPTAAARITAGIAKKCDHLRVYPHMGISLAEKTGRDTLMRVLLCENHLVFYRVEKDCVSILRVLDGRTDYLRVLFMGGQ